MAELKRWELRSYLPERKQKRRRWTGKPAGEEAALRANRRRVRGQRGRWLQRLRSELVERSFAHVCESGGARRTWLRGLAKTGKRYLVAVMGHNLGLFMWKLFGAGKPREFAAVCVGCLVALNEFTRTTQAAIVRIRSYQTCLAQAVALPRNIRR